METRNIEISFRTFLFIIAFLTLLWALYLIRNVIILLFIAIIIMSALSPLVSNLEHKFKLHRVFAVFIVYGTVLIFIASLLSIVLVPLIEQTTKLAQELPRTIDNLLPSTLFDRNLLQQEITNITRNALSFTLTAFNSVLEFALIIALSFYLLLQRDKLDQMLIQLSFGRDKQVIRISQKIEEKLGAWFRGQVILSLLIALLSYIVLLILQVPYALPLAILSGILEVVPVIGPIISAIPAVLIAYFQSPLLALIVVVSYIIIQQLENHIIVPQVMRKAVGLNPLIVILAVAIGGKLLGIAGGLLAVPIAVVFQIIIEDIIKDEKLRLQEEKVA